MAALQGKNSQGLILCIYKVNCFRTVYLKSPLPTTNIYLEVRTCCCQDNLVAMEDLSAHFQLNISEHLVAFHQKHHLKTTKTTLETY